MIGIGRINNFVESLTVAVVVEGERVLRSWSPIIPKSILFVITDMNSDETKWNLDILVKPTEKLPLIVMCDGVFLITLGLVIVILHLNEKSDD
jgi:integrin alpha FG-GAP repeat containing protein 1